MIDNYSKNACPVIEAGDLRRAIMFLPNRVKVNEESKSDTHIVLLDDDEEKAVLFDWDEVAGQWRLRNKIVFKPNGGRIIRDCIECGKIEHIVNKSVTKVKCSKCNKISNL
jgi:hypothetical protein